MKRIGLLLALTFVLILVMGGLAYANFGPHGNYVADTDKCAGCHRAHTSPNPIRWMDKNGAARSALLVTTTATIRDFCETCHGGNAPGAATDVVYGVLSSIYKPGGPLGVGEPIGPPPSGWTANTPLAWPLYVAATGQTLNPDNYQYNALSPANIPFATLNSGGFYSLGGDPALGGVQASSVHNVQWDATITAWGDGITGSGTTWNAQTNWGVAGTGLSFSCDACHDPHGSSNYRILNDMIMKPTGERIVVGGYGQTFPNTVDPNPNPFVISNEDGYPLAGFRLHQGYPNYKPDYTTARYAKATTSERGISGWCIACHEQYTTKVGINELRDDGLGSGFKPGALNPNGLYNAGDGTGAQVRHRHPMNVPLSNFYIGGVEANGPVGDRALIYDPNAWTQIGFSYVDLPLEHDPWTEGQGDQQVNSISDHLGCLTCHRAHGTAASMARWAVSSYESWDPYKPHQGNSGTPQAPEWGSELIEDFTAQTVSWTTPGPQNPQQGVPPANSSALLRADNRGVCERCHNK